MSTNKAIAKLSPSSFARDTTGNVAVTFALLLLPAALAVGAGVDYSRANNIKASLQAALDSAVLAGLHDNTSTRDQTATNAFNANFVPEPRWYLYGYGHGFCLDDNAGAYAHFLARGERTIHRDNRSHAEQLSSGNVHHQP